MARRSVFYSRRDLADAYNNYYKLIDTYLKHIRKLHVSYEEILKAPVEELRKIIDFLNIYPTKQQYTEAISFIKPELDHKGNS